MLPKENSDRALAEANLTEEDAKYLYLTSLAKFDDDLLFLLHIEKRLLR